MRILNRTIYALAALLATVLFAAESCDDTTTTPAPDSDSAQSYKTGSTIPIDDAVYRIRGEVIGPVNDVTRQIEPAKGDLSGTAIGGYGTISGSFTGPIEAGKGFVRIRVQTSDPATDLAPLGDVTIVKTSDTKVKALLAGDVVEFACRRQYEAIAAITDGQTFNPRTDGTWELDYCRMSSPVITVKPQQ